MKVSDVLTGILLALFGIAVLLYSQTFPPIPGQDFGPRAFPSLIGAAFIVCAILLIRKGLAERPRAVWVHLAAEMRNRGSLFRVMLVPLMMVMYILFSESVGFVILAFIFLMVLFLAFGLRPILAVSIAVLGSVCIFYAFYSILRVPLPWGLLEGFL